MTVSELDPLFVRIFAWLWGAVWGSFFNVAIHRWPRGLSVLSPPSHCPACGSPIPPWLNVPVFSYIALRGKARCCGAEIPIRYLLVEVLSAFLGLAIAERFLLNQPGHALGPAFLETLAYFAFSGALLIATFVDLEHTEIPDESSLGGMAIGLLSLPWRDLDPMDAAVGAGAAYLLSMLLPIWAWEQITGQRGMGEGDAKLLGCIGAFLGWQGVIFVVIASSVQGLLFYVISNIAKRGRPPSSHHHHNKPCAEPNPSQPAAEREHSPNPNHEANSSPSTDHGNSREESIPTIPFAPKESDLSSLVVSANPPFQSEIDIPYGIKIHTKVTPSQGGAVRLELSFEEDHLLPDAPFIRFAPFLSLSALEFLFFGERIVDVYLRWLVGGTEF